MTASEPTWRAMYEIAISALRMTREAVEALGPAASLESREAVLLRGPEPVHEGEAQCEAIRRYRDNMERERATLTANLRQEIEATARQRNSHATRAEAAEADRDALADKLEKAEHTREEWRWTAHESATAADALGRRVQALEEALRPFAAVAERDIGTDETDGDLFRSANKHNRAPLLTVGDLRRAAAALSAGGAGREGEAP